MDQNIKSGFQATGLIPYNPQYVLSSLTIVKTPPPPGTANEEVPLWTLETSRNFTELE